MSAKLCFRFKPTGATGVRAQMRGRSIRVLSAGSLAYSSAGSLAYLRVVCVALTIGAPEPVKDQLTALMINMTILRNKAKYGEPVVYAGRCSGGGEASVAWSHLGDVRGVFTRLRS